MKHSSTILLAILGAFLFAFAVFVYEAPAGASDNVSGYAWSENIGWVSFSGYLLPRAGDIQMFG